MKEQGSGHFGAWAALLLLGGAGFRVYFAWLNRFCLNLDFPVVALAAKHIAEGKDVPLFLYGQGYLGTLEPMAGALFCRLLGTSEFAVSLGAVACSFFMLPVVYLWASDLGGRRAGLWALAICVVTPPLVSGYSVISVGGYAATLSIIPAILWLTGRAAADRGGRPAAGRYLLVGLLGGLGWWTFPLVLPALLAAAAVLLFAGPIRSLPKKAAAGLFGFAAGSAPFWYWNARNGWQTFTMTRSFGEGDAATNISALFTARIQGLFGWDAYPAPAGALAMAVLLAAAVYVIGSCLIAQGPAGRIRKSAAAVAALFLVAHTAFLAASHFGGLNTNRYLLPLFPVAAVFLGVAAAGLARRVSSPVALAAVLFFCLPQSGTVPDWRERSAREAEGQRAAAAVGTLLDEKGAEAAYISYHEYELNFALRERFAFSELAGERYTPYFTAAEESAAPMIIGDLGGFPSFLRQTGGAARGSGLPIPYNVAHYGYAAPSDQKNVLPEACVSRVRDQAGRDVTDIVTGSDGATAWTSAGDEEAWLEAEFCRPVPLAALRLWAADRSLYPETWVLEGRLPGDRKWVFLTGSDRGNFYFWSGDRPYWGGETFRLQAGFAPRKVEAVRFKGRSGGSRSWGTSSVQFLFPRRGDAGGGDGDDLAAVAAYVGEHGLGALYADRGATNALSRLTNGTVRLADHTGTALPGRVLPARVVLTEDTAFLVRTGQVKIFRRLLQERRIFMNEKTFGSVTLFFFPSGAWRPAWEELAGLHWTGYGAVKRYHKRYAQRLYLEAMEEGAGSGERESLLRGALAAYEGHGPARTALGEVPGGGPGPPVRPVDVVFRGGIELVGVTAGPLEVRPGETVAVKLLWKVDENSHPERYFSYLHFRDEGIAFQDDHLLLGHLRELEDSGYQPFPETFVETREIRVPPGTRPGTYPCSTGLIRRGTEKRVPLRTELPHRKGTAALPLLVTVLP